MSKPRGMPCCFGSAYPGSLENENPAHHSRTSWFVSACDFHPHVPPQKTNRFCLMNKPNSTSRLRLAVVLGTRPEAIKLIPAERAFLDSLAAGIDADSGMLALDRVLSQATPSVLTVSSMDLQKLQTIQDQAMAQLESEPGVKFQRPNLSSEYSKPADAVEQQLADWWEELLGVEKVGAEDDFFEVGGHSLVAVRLFAQIKKK